MRGLTIGESIVGAGRGTGAEVQAEAQFLKQAQFPPDIGRCPKRSFERFEQGGKAVEDRFVRFTVGQRHFGHGAGGDKAGQPNRIVQYPGGRVVDRFDREGTEMVGESAPASGR